MSVSDERIRELSRDIFYCTVDEIINKYTIDELMVIYNTVTMIPDDSDSVHECMFDTSPSSMYPILFMKAIKQDKYASIYKNIKMLSKLDNNSTDVLYAFDEDEYIYDNDANSVESNIGMILQTDVLFTLVSAVNSYVYGESYMEAIETMLAVYKDYNLDRSDLLNTSACEYDKFVDSLTFDDNIIKIYGTLLLPALITWLKYCNSISRATAKALLEDSIQNIDTSKAKSYFNETKKEVSDLIWV